MIGCKSWTLQALPMQSCLLEDSQSCNLEVIIVYAIAFETQGKLAELAHDCLVEIYKEAARRISEFSGVCIEHLGALGKSLYSEARYKRRDRSYDWPARPIPTARLLQREVGLDCFLDSCTNEARRRTLGNVKTHFVLGSYLLCRHDQARSIYLVIFHCVP